jgi:hypothetical protein
MLNKLHVCTITLALTKHALMANPALFSRREKLAMRPLRLPYLAHRYLQAAPLEG